jgi:hypothetical protein
MFWMAMAAVIAVAIVCGGAMAVAVVGLAAAVIVLGVTWNQTRPGGGAVAAVNNPVLDGAIAAEAQRLRASAGSDAQCVADSAAIMGQGAKDEAIVSCFLSRLRQENRSAIGRELFRMKALEVAGDG